MHMCAIDWRQHIVARSDDDRIDVDQGAAGPLV